MDKCFELMHCPRCKLLAGKNKDCPICHGREMVRLGKRGIVFGFRIEKELLVWLKDIAKQHDVTTGKLCHDIILEYIKELK